MPDQPLALVTGAAGEIGQAVCARLAGQGQTDHRTDGSHHAGIVR